RQRERKRTGSAHHAVVVPNGVHTIRGQDTRERRDLILARPRAPKVVPDRAHRRPHLLHRCTNPNLPLHPTPPSYAPSHGHQVRPTTDVKSRRAPAKTAGRDGGGGYLPGSV